MSLPQTYILIQDGDNIIELCIEHSYNMAPGMAEAIKKELATRVLWEKQWALPSTPGEAALADEQESKDATIIKGYICQRCGAELTQEAMAVLRKQHKNPYCGHLLSDFRTGRILDIPF